MKKVQHNALLIGNVVAAIPGTGEMTVFGWYQWLEGVFCCLRLIVDHV